MVFRTFVQAVAKRVPSIKFRKQRAEEAAISAVSGHQGSASGASVTSRATIEDWELPKRYQRRPLDQIEIEYINRGGPA